MLLKKRGCKIYSPVFIIYKTLSVSVVNTLVLMV